MSGNFRKVILKLLFPFYWLRKKSFIWMYNSFYKKRNISRIFKTDSIKVLFLVINIGMWKSNKLFELLREDKRFAPFIVTSFIPSDTSDYKEYIQNAIVKYFDKLGFPVIQTYDPCTRRMLSIKDLRGDIIFYPQPYHNIIREFDKRALYAYIPYDYPIQDDKVFHNFVYHNICWKIFAVNEKYKRFEEKYSDIKGKNVKVVGFSNSDYYFDNHPVSISQWKIQSNKFKKIIWAPHHSINESDTMGQALFLELADEFWKLTQRYKGICQFVFKPHPRLKDKLYQRTDWGIVRTDEYYSRWENGDNTSYSEGDYIDLFLSSDAMIHDCSSFIAEYLYTGHPVMFTIKKECDFNFDDNDKVIFNSMYHGYSISDIEVFINNVVLEKNDPKREERHSVLLNELAYEPGTRVCDRIFKELVELAK